MPIKAITGERIRYVDGVKKYPRLMKSEAGGVYLFTDENTAINLNGVASALGNVIHNWSLAAIDFDGSITLQNE